LPGDKHLVKLLRRLIRGKKVSGVKKVFVNLCMGFNELNIDYDINLPFHKIKPGEPVVVLGEGAYALEGYDRANPIIAGIGLMTHPAEWPTLFDQYPVAKYLQHSAWANNVYIPYYGLPVCEQWAAGIETDKWQPFNNSKKTIDFLIYNKIRWEHEKLDNELRLPIIDKLTRAGFTYREIFYGQYKEAEYFDLLKQSRAMLFLCEHESQGFACCEALSMNVPVLAWNQGFWLDPNRFAWGTPVVKASSIPFFDVRCGLSFNDIGDFDDKLDTFWAAVTENKYNPRAYILENLTLKKSALHMLEIVKMVYK
jgi:hypothetical protein